MEFSSLPPFGRRQIPVAAPVVPIQAIHQKSGEPSDPSERTVIPPPTNPINGLMVQAAAPGDITATPDNTSASQRSLKPYGIAMLPDPKPDS